MDTSFKDMQRVRICYKAIFCDLQFYFLQYK